MCVCVCVSICAQSYTTLCDPMHCSPPGSSVHEIFQARILGQVDISYSRGSLRSREQNYIFLHLLHWLVDSLPLLHHLGSPIKQNTDSKIAHQMASL